MDAKKTTKKVPVTRRALIARINRKLAYARKKLCASRSPVQLECMGAYFILNTDKNEVVDSVNEPSHGDKSIKPSERAKDWLLALARELNVMGEWERLAEE
jgi:hypothetical protein